MTCLRQFKLNPVGRGVTLPCMLRFWMLIFICTAMIGAPAASIAAKSEEDIAPGRKMAQQAIKEKKLWITSDHSQHEILKQEFNSGPEVTKACLTCHNQAASQFHQTIHWTWMDPITEASAKLGKGGLSVNNF
jgi:hypothetical protein